MDKKKTFIKNNYWMLFPIIHIIASFFYERAFFNWDMNLGAMFAVPINESVSNASEFVITYIFSKAIACVFIWLIWKLIFGIIKKQISAKVLVIFGTLFVLYCLACVIKWPQSMIGDGGSDHLITYLYAKSFVPYYWHAIFTGCLYSACFMVVPTAFALPVLQCLMVFGVLGYIFDILDRYTEKIGKFKWAKYLTLVAVISPLFLDLITNSWRCCYYAILTMLFFAMILETVLLEDKASIRKIIIVMIIAAILAVWRSEGILYGAPGFFAMLVWGCRYKWKKVVLWMLLFCSVFYLLGRPGKIGQEKYYGKDYLMVCFVSPLANIFNDSNNNLSYEGANDDIAAIEAVVPISVLRQYKYMGYLSNNYSKGYVDIDQSGATKEEGAAFVKASISIILHNPGTYVKSQINVWLDSFDYDKRLYIEEYIGEKDEYKGFSLAMWNDGKAELLGDAGVNSWANNATKNRAMYFIDKCSDKYIKIWEGKSFFNFKLLGLLALVLMDCVIALAEIINIFKKRYRDMMFGGMSLVLLAVLAATILMMPTPFVAYFYTFVYCSFMVGVFYGIRKLGEKATVKK